MEACSLGVLLEASLNRDLALARNVFAQLNLVLQQPSLLEMPGLATLTHPLVTVYPTIGLL